MYARRKGMDLDSVSVRYHFEKIHADGAREDLYPRLREIAERAEQGGQLVEPLDHRRRAA